MINHQRFKNYSITLVVTFLAVTLSFSQNDTPFLIKLKEIDEKVDHRNYDAAKILLKKVQLNNNELSIEEKYALDLRVAKVQHYADDNNSLINHILANLDEINKMETTNLQYDYLTFIGQVFKGAKNFKKAIFFNKQALLNAEKRQDTVDIIFSCLKIGRSMYRVEYFDSPELYKNNKDSAMHYYKKALNFPENNNNNKLFTRIYDNLSKIQAKTGELVSAEKYAIKALTINKNINNDFGIAISLNNLSTIHLLKNKSKKAIEYAKESNDFIKDKSLSIRKDNLEKIAKGYKLLGDNKKALTYLEEAADISDRIAKRTLAKEINTIEAKHNVAREQTKTVKEKNKRQLIFYIALAVIAILITFSSLFYIRSKAYKKRFNKLISTIENEPKKAPIKNNKLSGVPSKVVKDILQKLERFEKKNQYLTKNLTLNLVAENLETNPTYLSKVINFYKDKNFTTYLNEARVNYAAYKLKNDKRFQKYTIKAIADECGFNNAESFSLAFHKKTSLYPSYFIKQLQKL